MQTTSLSLADSTTFDVEDIQITARRRGVPLAQTFDPAVTDAVVAGLLGGIDVEGGPTVEQLAVLRALTSHYLGRPDIKLEDVTPLGPTDVAEQVTGPNDRRRFHHLHVALEAARHPQVPAQVTAVERYASALAVEGPDLVLFRSLIERGVEGAAADYRRFSGEMLPRRAEPSLVIDGSDPGAPEPELAARLEAFGDLPAESLGQAYLRFYERTGLNLPGSDPALMNHFYMAHDMTHVIAGIATSAPAEIALSGFMVAMDDNDVNFSALLASLIIHEAGFGRPTSISQAESESLTRPGAAELLGREMARGAQCTGDFSLVDHFALAPQPLSHVRAQFGVRVPDDPDDGFHIW